MQRVVVVAVENLDRLLSQDRAGVHAGVHQVNRAPGDFHAVVQRVRDRVRAGKRRQQRGVGVDHPADEARKEFGAKYFHEAG